MARLGVVAGSVIIVLGLCASVRAHTVVVYFLTETGLVGVHRSVPEGTPPIETALAALAAGPTGNELATGITSAIPPGTTVREVIVDGPRVTVDFSAELLAQGLNESTIENIFRQANWTLGQFNLDSDVRLTVGGELLCEYLPPVPMVKPGPPRAMTGSGPLASLSGHSITLSPGHGYNWNGSGWYTQRPVYCAPLNEEDMHNLEMAQYLETYLVADGMVVKVARCTDKTYGNYPSPARPWWQMGAYLWLKHLGYPCSVYAADTDDCTLGTGASEHYDDVYSRPLASNYDGTDIYISLHTDGLTGYCVGAGCPTGTKTFYDAGTVHAPWGGVSQALAEDVQAGMINAFVSHVDSTWTCDGACTRNSNGAYGEIRLPERAAILIELAFHDTCDRDANEYHLRENFFRSAAMWGIYKGVCDYFETTPTWDFYSDEFVSDTIPATMTGDQTYLVDIKFRNRGVLWSADRGFRLGAVGDSDPFTSSVRISPGTEIGPGMDSTFTVVMTAPRTPGQYTTDWRMLREGVDWFGATLTRQVEVLPPLVRSDFDNDTDVDLLDFAHIQMCLSGSSIPQTESACWNARLDDDSDVDQDDMGIFIGCLTGPGEAAHYSCED